MIYEFEGRTEKEAIDCAAEELGLAKDDFDVEIIETQRQSLFKKGHVRIRVHTNKPVSSAYTGHAVEAADGEAETVRRPPSRQPIFGDPSAQNEFEQKMTAFVEGVIEHMGYGGKVLVLFARNPNLA